MTPECPGGRAGDRQIMPPSGHHDFGRAVERAGQRTLVCSFCGLHAPVPAGEAKREPQVGSSGLKPLVKLPGYTPAPPNLLRTALTLREKQAQLAGLRQRLLTRDEAVKAGFPQHEIDLAWPPNA
jgi:hypothetical protein